MLFLSQLRYDGNTYGGPMRFLIALLFCLILVCLTPVLAQQPQLTVNSYTIKQGETLSLRASNLELSASYTLTLIAPGGESTARTLRSDSRGEVRYEGALELAGDWTVALRGEDINAMLGVTVAAATASNPLNQSQENPLAQETEATPDTNQTTPAETTQDSSPTPAEQTPTETQPQTNQAETPTTETQQSTSEQTLQSETATESTQTESGQMESGQTETTSPTTNQADTEEATQPTTNQADTNPTETAQDSMTLTEPAQAETAITSSVNVKLEQGTLTAIEDDKPKWTLDFPKDSVKRQGLLNLMTWYFWVMATAS
jgi:hypothetical protein